MQWGNYQYENNIPLVSENKTIITLDYIVMHSVFMCRHAGICMVCIVWMEHVWLLYPHLAAKFVFEQSTTGSCMAFMLQYFIIFIFAEFPHLKWNIHKKYMAWY
jgi:hypothetical protein